MMGGPFLLAAGIGGLSLIGGLVTFLLLRQRLLERRCLADVRQAERLLDEQPNQANDLARQVCQKLDSLAQRGKLGQRGAEALAWAHVLTAVRHHRTGQPDEADLRLEEVRGLFADEVESRRWLLRYYLAVGEASSESVACCREYFLDKAARFDVPSRERVQELFRTACELRPGLDARALAERIKWNQAARQCLPDASWPLTNEGLARYRLGRHEQARQILTEVVGKHADDWKARAGLARVCAALGDADRARQELTALVQQQAQNPAVLLEVAAQRAALRDLSEANDLLKTLSGLDPSMAGEALALQGRLALKFGQPERALPALAKAFAQQPEDRRLALLLAEAHSQSGDPVQALQIVLRAVPRDATEPELQFAVACAYLNAGHLREAESWLERCSLSNYRSREVLKLQVHCQLRLGRSGTALQLLQSGKLGSDETGDLAFYHGVALYQGAAPDKAVPHFTRALNQARRRNDRVLQDRAFANLYACYLGIAARQVREEMFALAAQTFESLRRMIKSGHADYAAVTRNLAECHVRVGLLRLSKTGPDPVRDNLALPPLEQAVHLGANPQTRMILAGVYCRLGRYAEAAKLYNDLLRAAPAQETLRFARGLASVLAGDRGDGLNDLNTIASGEGRFALRAALALAAAEANDGKIAAALNRLVSVVRRPGARDDEYFGEVGSRAILYAIRVGQMELAENLATALFADMALPTPLLLGCLLAEEGEYAAALAQFENPAAASPRFKEQRQTLLHATSCRLAYDCFKKGAYDEAKEVVTRALKRTDDPDLRQFGKLLVTAAHNLSTADIGDPVLRLLDELVESAGRPEPMLVRSALVAYHRQAFQLALVGRHPSSRKYWDRASVLWKDHIEGQGRFWKGYLADYNRGKDYTLKSTISEVEQRIRRRLAGLYVMLCQAVLLGRIEGASEEDEIDREVPAASNASLNEELEALEETPATYGLSEDDPAQDDNDRVVGLFRYYWKRAWNITGKQGAVELFKEIVDVPALVGKLDAEQNPEQVFALYRILHDFIDPTREEYRAGLASLSIRLALKALQQDRIKDFFEYLRTAGSVDADYRSLSNNVRALRKSVVSLIVREFQGCATVQKLRRKGSEEALNLLLFRVIGIYAALFPHWEAQLSEVDGIEDVHIVRISFDAVLGAAVESLTEN